MDISVGSKTPMGKTVDEVILEMTMPKGVLNVSLTASQGKYSFEPTSKLLIWNVGKIEVGFDFGASTRDYLFCIFSACLDLMVCSDSTDWQATEYPRIDLCCERSAAT